ncbi:MAG: DUF4337 family protein [Planctomycetes bacterium]|nr:DUF4337 family protein [Planctomycetota bacterium]
MTISSDKNPEKKDDENTKPKGKWASILATVPIVLTILATVFAGLSSSEMTQAMYFRSLASQHQSKAGDQWAFFQAKRIRGTSLEMTAELMQSLGQPAVFDVNEVDSLCQQLGAALRKEPDPKTSESAGKIEQVRAKLAKLLADETVKQSLPNLNGSNLPKIENATLPNQDARESLEAAVKAIGERQTEIDTADLIRKLKFEDIDQAAKLAEQNADRFDKASDDTNDTIKKLRALLTELAGILRPYQDANGKGGSSVASLVSALDAQIKGFKLAAVEFDARRYRQESFYNRKAAEVYETRVRRSGIESDRHRERSKNFFYSMLAAQAGVTVAALALARAQRKALWLFAAIAGLAAVGFGSFVYVSM